MLRAEEAWAHGGASGACIKKMSILAQIRDKGLARRVQNVLKSGAGGAIQQEDMEMELRFTGE